MPTQFVEGGAVTTRDLIKHRLRRVSIVSTVGFIWFAGGLIVGKLVDLPWVMALGVAAFPVILAAELYGVFWPIRCPECRGYLNGLARGEYLGSRHPSFQFCPYCGRRLDAESHADVLRLN